MKQKLIQILKTIIADVRQAYVPVILLSVIGGTGTVFYFYERALTWTIQIVNTPTPLWATIALALGCCLYTYLHNQKLLKEIGENKRSSRTSKAEIDNSKSILLKFIFHNNLLWLSDDLSPLCPACYEIKGKIIHVKLLHGSNNVEEWDYYECHNCEYRADFSGHPDSVPF